MRTFDELRGSLASLRRALKRSSAGRLMSSAFAFSAARLAAYFATIRSRLAFRFIWLSFAMSSALSMERKLEAGEKRARLVVRLRGGVDDNVHAPNVLGLVVVDLDEDDVLLEAEREIPSAVEALGIKAAEIANPRQRHRDEAVQELVHPVLAQGHFRADRKACADLVGRDGLLGARDYRLLAGDRR